MRTFRLHVRTSPARLIAPLFLAIALVILLRRQTYWVGLFPETGAAAQVPVYFLSIFTAGLSAWVAGAVVRQNMTEQTGAGSVSMWRAESYRYIVLVLGILAPYLIIQVGAAVVTLRYGPPGWELWLGYVAMGAVALVLAVAVGWSVGKWIGSVFGPIVAILLWFAVVNLLAPQGSAVHVLSGDVWVQPNGMTLLARAGAALLLSLVAIGVRTSWRRLPTAGAAAATAAALFVAGGAVFGGSGVQDRPLPEKPLCFRDQTTICVWPEEEKYRSMIESFYGPLRALPKQFILPARVNSYGLERLSIPEQYRFEGGPTYQLTGGFQVNAGNRWSIGQGLATEIVQTTFKGCNIEAMYKDMDQTYTLLGRWIELTLGGAKTPPYRTFGVSGVQQNAWRQVRVIVDSSTENQYAWVRQLILRFKAKYCA